MTWLTRAALGVLALLTAAGSLSAAWSADSLTAFLPELAPVQDQLVALGLAFGACIVALLMIAGVLVGYMRPDRIFRPAALRLVDALVLAVVATTVTVIVALFFIPGPPQLFLLVEAGVLVGTTTALVLLVMRSFLRRAAAMHAEPDKAV